MAEAIAPNCKKEIIGIRAGEKIHEEMITIADSYSTIDLGEYFAILPIDGFLKEKYIKRNIKFKEFEVGTSYSSLKNEKFLNLKEIRDLIVKNVEKEFIPY